MESRWGSDDHNIVLCRDLHLPDGLIDWSGRGIHAEHVPDREGIYGVKHFVLMLDPLCDSNARTSRKNLPAPFDKFEIISVGFVHYQHRLHGAGVRQK